MGPAVVSILFFLVFFKIYGAFQSQNPTTVSPLRQVPSTNLHDALRFARILMNVGLFWFFIQAWAEKAGYLRNPHSNDEIDLPFEFAGTMLGFWMARVLTKPFDESSERFRSTLFVDFVSFGGDRAFVHAHRGTLDGGCVQQHCSRIVIGRSSFA